MTGRMRIAGLIPFVSLVFLAAGHGAPHAFVADPVMNFGRVEGGRSVEHCFALENRGVGTLHIEKIDPGCDSCLSWVLESDKVEPGGVALLTVSLDTSEIEGEISRKLAVCTDDPGNSVMILSLSGEVAPRFIIRPRAALFGEIIDRNARITRKLRVLAASDSAQTLDSAVSSSARFAVALRERKDDQAAYDLEVSTVPPLEEGWNKSQIVVSGPGGDRCVVRAEAYVAPSFAVMPARLRFDPDDGEQVRILFVRQNSMAPMILTNVSGPFPRAVCDVLSGPRASDCRVMISVTGLSAFAGRQTNMALYFNRPGGLFTVPVEVVAAGQEGRSGGSNPVATAESATVDRP